LEKFTKTKKPRRDRNDKEFTCQKAKKAGAKLVFETRKETYFHRQEASSCVVKSKKKGQDKIREQEKGGSLTHKRKPTGVVVHKKQPEERDGTCSLEKGGGEDS